MEQSKQRAVQRVRHELRRRDVVVASVTPVGANFVSVTFQGEALADFVSLSFDDHVKFMIPDASGEPVRRDYTPRRYDVQSRELTIEFALHGEGAASDWARQARPGQEVTIGGPRGSMIIPLDYDWHLMVGDATALPAIRRRLDELPASSRVIVVALAEEADRVELAAAAQVDLHWVADEDALIDSVRALQLPAGEGFAWGAGEAGAMRRLRDVLVTERGVGKEAMRVSAYWKKGVTDHHENLD